MSSFAAWMRRILLVVFLLSLLVVLVTRSYLSFDLLKIVDTIRQMTEHFDYSKDIWTIICLLSLVSGSLYLLVSIVSVITRMVKNRSMEKNEMLISLLRGLEYVHGNIQVISFFRRLAFWGTIMLLVNVFAIKTSIAMITTGPFSESIIQRGYHGYLLWSAMILIPLWLASIVFWSVYLIHEGEGAYNVFEYIGRMIANDVMTPVRIVKRLINREERSKRLFYTIFSFVVLLLFIAVNAVGIVASL